MYLTSLCSKQSNIHFEELVLVLLNVDLVTYEWIRNLMTFIFACDLNNLIRTTFNRTCHEIAILFFLFPSNRKYYSHTF